LVLQNLDILREKLNIGYRISFKSFLCCRDFSKNSKTQKTAQMDLVYQGVVCGIVRKWVGDGYSHPVSFDLVTEWLKFHGKNEPKSKWYKAAEDSLIQHKISNRHLSADSTGTIVGMTVAALIEWCHALNTAVSQDIVNICTDILREVQMASQQQPAVIPLEQPCIHILHPEMMQQVGVMFCNMIQAEDYRRNQAFQQEEKRRTELHAVRMKREECELRYWQFMATKTGLAAKQSHLPRKQ
jgi:hypothetical protein